MATKTQNEQALQRKIAFEAFLPHCLARQPDFRQAALDALEAAAVALAAADEYFEPKPEPKPGKGG